MDLLSSRYARHYSLPGFDVEAQKKLQQAKVLIIGAGGLGCPALQYLAASGVGSIGIVDHDSIALSNLPRQILYETKDVGKSKTLVAAQKLKDLNPEILISSYEIAVTTENAFELISAYDVIVDCTDNFSSRYLINDACALMNKPLVFGAVFQFEGQVAVFNVSNEKGLSANYRNLFPVPPNPLDVQDCNEAGVLGALTGIIGTVQATEVIKLITGFSESLTNKLMTFNLLSYETFIADIFVDDSIKSLLPKNQSSFEATNYQWLCGEAAPGISELNASDFLSRIIQQECLVIDVRETNELPKVDFKSINIPLSQLSDRLNELHSDNIILFCQSGKRSLKAAELLAKQFGTSIKISHLSGGIIKLQETQL